MNIDEIKYLLKLYICCVNDTLWASLKTQSRNEMKLKDLIERGYFPKELPPPFDTSDLSANIAATLASWTTIFENNTQINSGTFVLTQNPGETPQQFKARKNAHRKDFI